MRVRDSGRIALALAAAFSLAAAMAACTDGGSDTVTIFTAETDLELRTLEEAFDTFTEETGIDVAIESSPNFETDVEIQIRSGHPPDIAMFPQPGNVGDHVDDIRPLSDELAALAEENFTPDFTDLVTFGGELKAVPVKADLKSLIWYNPTVFADAGYEVPKTFDDFLALTDQMMADGNPPFCVGIEAGTSSGWPLTDWIEDFLLRLEGPELYDRWYRHEIPFDHPAVVEAGELVADLWSQDGFVYGGTDAAAVTAWTDAGLPVLDGECMMHRQAHFYAVNWPEGTELGADGDVDAFYLPGSEEHPNVVLSGGIYAAAFSDDDNVTRVMEFLASTDYANARASNEIGGFLSPNQNVDVDVYPNELMRRFGQILTTADPVRFDASDLMPGVIGSGAFWTAAVDVTIGSKDVATAFADVEARWP